MSHARHHIVPLVRIILTILLLFSTTRSMTGSCPHMAMDRQEMKKTGSCCAAESSDRETGKPIRSCCTHDGHLCTCYPPLLLMGNEEAGIEIAMKTTMPAPLLEERLHDLSSDPPIPPPKG